MGFYKLQNSNIYVVFDAEFDDLVPRTWFLSLDQVFFDKRILLVCFAIISLFTLTLK